MGAKEGIDKEQLAEMEAAAKQAIRLWHEEKEKPIKARYYFDLQDQMEWNITREAEAQHAIKLAKAEAELRAYEAEQKQQELENDPIHANLSINAFNSLRLRNLVRAERQPTYREGVTIGKAAKWVPPPSVNSSVPDYIRAAMAAKEAQIAAARAAQAAIHKKVQKEGEAIDGMAANS